MDVSLDWFGRAGSFYTMEAAIAAIMMIIAVVFFFQNPPQTLELSRANYKMKVYDALEVAEDLGDMRNLALDNQSADIEEELELYIPAYIDFGVTVYNDTTNLTEIPDIEADNVITVSYYISGMIGDYDPREVRVFIWNFD